MSIPRNLSILAENTSSLGVVTTATNANNVAITNNAATATSVYLTWVTANTGNLPVYVTSTKLSFTPSTGALQASQLIIAP